MACAAASTVRAFLPDAGSRGHHAVIWRDDRRRKGAPRPLSGRTWSWPRLVIGGATAAVALGFPLWWLVNERVIERRHARMLGTEPPTVFDADGEKKIPGRDENSPVATAGADASKDRKLDAFDRLAPESRVASVPPPAPDRPARVEERASRTALAAKSIPTRHWRESVCRYQPCATWTARDSGGPASLPRLAFLETCTSASEK